MPEESLPQNREKVGLLLESKLNVPKSSSVSWLGKSSGNKSRLLPVTLDDEQHKRTIMKQATKLQTSQRWNTIYVTPDHTFI